MYIEYFAQLIDKTKNLILLHKRASTLVLIGLGIFLLLCIVFSKWFIVYIHVNKPSGVTITKSYIRQDSQENKTSPRGGIKFIPRNATAIMIESDAHMRTISSIKAPWYGFVFKKIELRYDRNATKIAYKSTLDNACGVYSKSTEQLLQYSCRNPQALVRFNAPEKGTWGVESIFNNMYYPYSQPTPYQDGIIGITDIDHTEKIAVAHGNGKLQTYDLPDDYLYDKIADTRLFVDTLNPDNHRFGIIASNGDVYLATPKVNTQYIDYRKLEMPNNYDARIQNTHCTISSDNVVCLRSISNTTHDIPSNAREIAPTIITASFSSSSTAMTKVSYSHSRLLIAEDFVVTKSGDLYAIDSEGVVYFDKHKNYYNARLVAHDASGIAAGEFLYFVRENGIFTIEPKTRDAHQILFSHNITPQKILTTGDNVFIIGQTPNSNGTSYAWKLNNEEDRNFGRRPIDKLPYLSTSSAYGNVDLVKNILKIDIPQGRGTTYSEKRRKVAQTIDQLENALGIDTKKFTVNYE